MLSQKIELFNIHVLRDSSLVSPIHKTLSTTPPHPAPLLLAHTMTSAVLETEFVCVQCCNDVVDEPRCNDSRKKISVSTDFQHFRVGHFPFELVY